MSASIGVMIRVVNPAAAPVNTPWVVPAPKISATGALVVTFPLVAVIVLPACDDVAMNGATASSPAYSVTRMSTYGVERSSVTVTTLAPQRPAGCSSRSRSPG